MDDRKTASKPQATAARVTEPEAIEKLIDEIGAQSFPASDPPAWGVVSARVEAAEHAPERSGD